MTPSDLFAWPAALPCLLLAPALWLLLGRLTRSRARRLESALGPRVGALAADVSPRRTRLRRSLQCWGLLFALVAVLQPVWGVGVRRIEQRGVDVVVCLDVSRSMLARDVVPSRLAHAQREVRAMAARVRGGRLGLVAFAGEARLMVPLTRDGPTFAGLVDSADPLSVEVGGTDLGAALERALEAFVGESGEHEAVLLLTDGEDHGQRGQRIAAVCAERGIPVHCVGLGSARGSKIPLAAGPEGSTGGAGAGETLLRDRTGAEVVSSLDASGLRKIAAATGGVFVDAGAQPRPLVELYESTIQPMGRKSIGSSPRGGRRPRFQWPLALALACWLLELGLTNRRRRRRGGP